MSIGNKIRNDQNSTEKSIAMKVSITSIIVNFLLSVGKLIAGVLGSSGAMISDAVHSASDVFSTFIVIIGVNISVKESDKEHPYGHERLESVVAILLSAILLATGIGIGLSGIEKIIGKNNEPLTVPNTLALSAAVISILVKEWMYWYTRAAAKKINSDSLMADAWHHRSDSLSSIGSFIGILGAMLGFPILDPIASVIICIFIAKAAYEIFYDSVKKLVDKSCDEKIVEQMKAEILKQKEIVRIDDIKTRMFGSKIYVDIEISADESISFKEAHDIAENVHFLIENKFIGVKHCMVHINPLKIYGNKKFDK